jgi:benzoyl-CoA reductase/2-hydroxyglutaryl-CoA dehydratase subunit BcrC/BadD/HgdB
VPQPKEVRDQTIDRLRELRARLQDRLAEAEDIRVKLTNARNANIWPDMKPASRLLVDYNDRRRAG